MLQLSPPIWRLFISQGKEQEEAFQLAIENLTMLEQELQGKKFFCGETIGLTDISLGPLAYVIPIYEEITKLKLIDAERFPLLSAWMEAFLNSPVVKDSLPPGEKLLLRYQALRESFLARGNK